MWTTKWTSLVPPRTDYVKMYTVTPTFKMSSLSITASFWPSSTNYKHFWFPTWSYKTSYKLILLQHDSTLDADSHLGKFLRHVSRSVVCIIRQMCLMRDKHIWTVCVRACVFDSGLEEVLSFHTNKALFHRVTDLWPSTLKRGTT